jgi:alpha-1,3-glucosyltransferase
MVYRNIEPAAMNIQRGYESESLKVFMRLSTLLVDMVFLLPPLILLSKELNKRISYLLILVVLLKPDAILIDHGHFQYNSLILGLILLAFYFILKQKYYHVCLLYTVAVHSKQMATYYSLAFLAALVGLTVQKYKHNRIKMIVEHLKYALIVIGVSLIVWAPWINHVDTLTSVISAIFPVHRGLYQLKVPNFWCISDIIFKWESLFSKPVLLFFCFASSIIASIPSIASLLINPNKKSLTIGFATIALTFFMFSYHVH